jgi:ribosomal-protein-alanine N-acetyltransferase
LRDEVYVNAVTLREYRRGDWDAMYALDVTCFESAFRFSRRAMKDFAEAAGAVSVLAVSEGKLVGFCVVQMEQQVGYVVTLDVATTWRRQGLARRLMAEVEAKSRAEGGVEIALHVYAENFGAIQFYESIGYGRVGSAEAFYGHGLDALIYAKRFES